MQAHDHLALDATTRSITRDGFLKVRAKAARTGHYQYTGREVDPDNKQGLRDQAIVNILRDEQTVFDKASVASFVGKPITNDHPTVAVTSENWRDHARGTIMGAVRDGEYIGFDLMVTDAAAIKAIDAGKQELSNGYSTELEFGDFTAADGTKCQARQTRITGNHVALVDAGRAGPECRIADKATAFAACDSNPARVAELSSITKDKAMKKIVLDGLQVDLTDADAVAAAFDKLQTQATEAQTALDAANKKIETLDAEKVTLTKQVADAKVTPAQLRDAAASYAKAVQKAKDAGVTITDSMDEPAIRKAVVSAKLGDAAKDWNDDQIAASFATMTADSKAADTVQNIVPGRTVANDMMFDADVFASAGVAMKKGA